MIMEHDHKLEGMVPINLGSNNTGQPCLQPTKWKGAQKVTPGELDPIRLEHWQHDRLVPVWLGSHGIRMLMQF